MASCISDTYTILHTAHSACTFDMFAEFACILFSVVSCRIILRRVRRDMSHDEFDFGIGDVFEVVYAPATVPEAGPGDGVTAPECLWPFQCPCLPCYYQLIALSLLVFRVHGKYLNLLSRL